MTDTTIPLTTKKDWTSDQEVRWCPGCGDYGILLAVQMLMPELGVSPRTRCSSVGIGCSSRFPYYMNTYGMHGIHGRAPAIATGVAVARPDLDVWVITGDGDGLSIGGNHLIHALRRNVNLTILLFNNRIYGLTKGQYSPTSELGKVTKSTPVGSHRPAVQPAGGRARCRGQLRRPHPRPRPQAHDARCSGPHTRTAARRSSRSSRTATSSTTAPSTTSPGARSASDDMIDLHHGQPIRFGPDGPRGVVMGPDGQLRLVEVAEVGEDALLVHDAHRADPSLAFALARLASDAHSPTPFGVFRAVERPDYGTAVGNQLAAASASKGPGDLAALLRSNGTWMVNSHN